MPETNPISEAFEKFKNHYAARLGQVEVATDLPKIPEIKAPFIVKSAKLKDVNYPTIFSQGQRTSDVIVLTHGLSDSTHYMLAIGKRFYQHGLNVVLPLLPGHGLKDPDKAMEDRNLDVKWRQEIDHAVDVGLLLGDRISLGGFSTGGALSLNKILRDPNNIKGILFIFSAAIDLGFLIETSSGYPVI